MSPYSLTVLLIFFHCVLIILARSILRFKTTHTLPGSLIISVVVVIIFWIPCCHLEFLQC